MAEQIFSKDVDDSASTQYSGWLKKDVFAEDNEVRIISQHSVKNRRKWKILLVITGLSIMIAGALPAITGDLPVMVRAVMLVGGLALALSPSPKWLMLVFTLLGSKPYSNTFKRNQNRSYSTRRNIIEWIRIYKMFKK